MWRAHKKKMDQHAAKLTKFFQKVRRGLSGHKSAREELKERIKKELIDFEEQLKEQLEQDLIDQVEQFEKERLKNEEQLETELIKYAEQLETNRIVQEVQSGTLSYYAWNKDCHQQGHNKDVSETKYWSKCCILTNQPTTTSFRQHNPFLHDAWCKKKKHKTDKRHKIKQHCMWYLQPAVNRQHRNQLLHDAWCKKRRHKTA